MALWIFSKKYGRRVPMTPAGVKHLAEELKTQPQSSNPLLHFHVPEYLDWDDVDAKERRKFLSAKAHYADKKIAEIKRAKRRNIARKIDNMAHKF